MMMMKTLNTSLNFKAMAFYERWTGESVFQAGSDEQMLKLAYSVLYVNNHPFPYTYDDFIDLKDSKAFKGFLMTFEVEMKSLSNLPMKVPKSAEKGEGTNNISISTLVSMLIVRYHLDAKWIMDEMELWMLPMLFDYIDGYEKEQLTDKRFWTFMAIAPHLDNKKVKKPQDILPFPWEHDDKKKFMEKNESRINNFFKQQENNGKG